MKRPVVIGLLVAALVLVCVGIGSVIYFANGFNVNNPFDTLQIPSSLEENETLEIDTEQPVNLTIDSDSGYVTVTGGDVDEVQVRVVKTAYDSTQERADEEVKTIQYTVEQNGNSIVLKYEIPRSVNIRNKVNTVDFIVIVPNNTSVDIETSFGDVDVTGLNGSVVINDDFGDVNVTNVDGAVEAHSNSGKIQLSSVNAGSDDINISTDFGTLILEKVSGKDITLQSNSGKLTLNDVRATGDIFGKSDFGNVEFENGSASNLELETNSGKISVIKVNVRNEIIVDDDFGNIELTQASANSYDLHTNSGSITIDGAKGNVKAYTDFGDIEIKNAVNVTLDIKTNSGTITFSGSLGDGPHNVKSDFGSIELTLPSDIKLNVNLSTDFGKITSDIPITVTLNGDSNSNGGEVVGELNGGGEELTVHTNSGSINIITVK